ncbi:hypothetical protein ASE30_07095 [Achromobacter sp. Root83]|uniref:hypothetical protein n=1 Tax=Achromobacter sp. Root83 TaxID=1736602 RepID=UPI000711028B|nr:hypothetical protein [Achromobacter sp. Root83]KRC76367.1 hypothetical protein ASE30_07095 [Achromobacter sp. Root83]
MKEGKVPCGIAVLILLGVVVLVVLVVTNPKAEVWAAWTQAIVAGAAIYGALHASRVQAQSQSKLQEIQRLKEIQRRRDEGKESTRRVMQALSDELEVRWAQLDGIYGPEILRAVSQSSRPILAVYNRMPAEPFPIYKSVTARIAEIPDADMRRELVNVYARFEGLVLTIESNSELVREYLTAVAEDRIRKQVSSMIPDGPRFKDAVSALQIYFPILQQHYKSTRAEVEGLIDKLRKRLNDAEGLAEEACDTTLGSDQTLV